MKNKKVCGNFLGETGETFSGRAVSGGDLNSSKACSFDVNPSCRGNFCNDYAMVECACKEYSILKGRHGCVSNSKSCSTCGTQEELFDEVLDIQTDVVKCLTDYFAFKPHRIVYKVFAGSNTEVCSLTEGCSGMEGGVGGSDYVLFNNLNGFREFGKNVPVKPEYITADVHETTHYFIYQMLHNVPNWFHEAVAIQTNERLSCTNRQMPFGDAYLAEKEGSGSGIVLSGGDLMNLEFYKKLKAGTKKLSGSDVSNHYYQGTLFMIGLKEDYKCGLGCVKDAVIKLREIEQDNCISGDEECNAISSDTPAWNKKMNLRIKDAFDSVTGKDTGDLFELLQFDM